MDTLAVLGLALALLVGAAAFVSRRRFHEREQEVRSRGERLAGARAELEVELARLRAALGGAEAGVVIADASGGIRFANPAADRYLGARHGQAVMEVRIEEAVERVLAEGGPVTLELDLYTPVRKVLRLRGVPLEEEAGRGALVYLEDLTERWRVDQMRRDFVANVSHELKTPLGAIVVLAETLSDDPYDPGVIERLAGRLAHEARRLGHLVENLLELSEVEGREAEREPVSVEAVAGEALGRVEPAAERAGVDVVYQPGPPGLRVAGDHRQLASAIFNLLDNAVKYSEAGSKVWLRVREEGERVLVEVEDRGVGIPPAHRERIFERFYRVDQARSAERGGTGLGLSIVKHVALTHGGTVEVDSEEGRGSVFRIELPRLGRHD